LADAGDFFGTLAAAFGAAGAAGRFTATWNPSRAPFEKEVVRRDG
jgi:hypothetical protein